MLILVILGHRQPAQNRIESCRLQEPGNSVMKLVIDPEHVVTAEGTQITKLGQVSSLTRWDARLNKNDPYEPHVLYFRPNLGLLASSFSFKQCNERPSFLTHGRIGHLYLTPVQFAQHRINCVLFYRKWTLPSFTINQVLEHSWSLVWKDSWRLSWLLQSNNTFFFSPCIGADPLGLFPWQRLCINRCARQAFIKRRPGNSRDVSAKNHSSAVSGLSWRPKPISEFDSICAAFD